MTAVMEESAELQPANRYFIDTFKRGPAPAESAVPARWPDGSDLPEDGLWSGWKAEDALAGLCLAALLASPPELFKLNSADQFFAALPRTRDKDRREPEATPNPCGGLVNDGPDCKQARS